MKILVTGGAGYKGSTLVPMLLAKGHSVTVVDNFMYNQISLLDCCYSDKLKIIRGDSRDKWLMSGLVKDCDMIIPLACLVGAPLCDKDPGGATSTNRDAITMLLELRSKAQPIIFPMTNSGYGVGEDGVFCTETSPMKPVSLYGKLKVETEERLIQSGNVVSLRFATVFGPSPRMRLDLLVNDFVYRAVVDGFVIIFEGHFKRNFLHIRDAARVYLHVMDNFEKMKDQSYNVGLSSANISKLDLCAEIRKQIPKFVYLESKIGEDPDKRNYIVSNDKIEKTGYKAEVSLEQGIRELINAYAVIRRNAHANI